MRANVMVIVVALSLGAAGCSVISNLGATEQVSCSVGGSGAFDPGYLDGPDMTPDEFVATPVGAMLQAFFVGGEGEPEGGSFTESDGFSIVSDSYVLGYRDGVPMADFIVADGDIQAWGGCNPTWVYSDRVAGRWVPVAPVDTTSAVLPIVVEGGACVDQDGTDIITEIVSIDVTETPATVEIVVWTREKGFRGMCAGIGVELPTEAELASPLGSRTLLDAGRIPAAPPEQR